jgi:hypothetical protein
MNELLTELNDKIQYLGIDGWEFHPGKNFELILFKQTEKTATLNIEEITAELYKFFDEQDFKSDIRISVRDFNDKSLGIVKWPE